MADFPVTRKLSAEEVDAFVKKFDHHDPHFSQDPYPVYDRLVQECPIAHSDNYGGFWVFTGHEEVLWGYQNYELISTSPSVSVPAGQGAKRPMLPMEVDPPVHTKYRALLSPVFAPNRMRALEPEIRTLCNDLIDSFVEKGECEFISEFAKPLPTRIFVKTLGIPMEETEQFITWNQGILHGVADDPDGAKRAAIGAAARGRLAELLEKRKAKRDSDVISVLIDSEVDGEKLDDEHLLDIAYLLFLAGLDTVQGVMGYQFAYLAANPDQRDRMIADPEVIPRATEELLRWEPVVTAGRTCTRDFEYKGISFKEGDRVVYAGRAAGRDPRVYDHPEIVDFDRLPGRTLAFGAGPHRCVGSHLARLELTIAHQEMLRRVPTYRLKPGTTVTSQGGNVAGLKELWLQWDV